ncbi:MAG TPA: rod shape-determining protein RodA, partial [Bacteroidales bacterium]|nr:rod shape-determining protein RodA [Bacteroidales bacterium]
AVVVLFFLVLLFPKSFVLLGVFIVFFILYILNESNKRNILIFLMILGLWVLLWLLFYKNFNSHISDFWFKVEMLSLLSTALVFGLVLLIRRLTKFLPLIGFFLLFAGFIFVLDYSFYHILEPHQQKRISILLGLQSDPKGVGYNVNQSKIAIGSGGFYGKGFLQGTQTKYNFVPEQSTDFIFCTIGEEWGFIGSTIFILIFVLLLWRIIILAERQRSVFSRVYAYGVLSIFIFHFMLNIGMTIGIMPVIGIPLPFISYGGSSLWTFIILIALLLRFDMNRNEIIR